MSVVLVFAPMCQNALCGSERCMESLHAPAGGRSTCVKSSSISASTPGSPANVVRRAEGQSFRYHSMAASGFTELSPT